MLNSIVRQTTSAGQRLLTIVSNHAAATAVARYFTALAERLRRFRAKAVSEPLDLRISEPHLLRTHSSKVSVPRRERVPRHRCRTMLTDDQSAEFYDATRQ
jgi:hypothetical protein